LPAPGIKIDKNVASTEENASTIEEMMSQGSSIEISNDPSNLIEKSIIEKINE